MIPPRPVISTKALRSGEISLRNVASPRVAGDLSALRFIRVQSLCTPYRQVPPLEMTMPAGSIQSFPERQIGQNDALPRHFDESEAERRNLTPKCGKPMVAGDLSTLRFTRAQSPFHPYRRVPPLEMTMSAGSIQSFPEGQIGQNDALPRHFDRSEVEWRNLTPKCGKLHSGRRSLGSAFQ